ncbi:MAG: hypothetical protein QME68_04645 [Elusimicrobiota bacterium]|nr:hypothetical protein [Elusimicrobiota bacterium]
MLFQVTVKLLFAQTLKHQIEFTYKPKPGEQIKSISIAGTFNYHNFSKLIKLS